LSEVRRRSEETSFGAGDPVQGIGFLQNGLRQRFIEAAGEQHDEEREQNGNEERDEERFNILFIDCSDRDENGLI
jgi:hypothetical protein